MSHNFIEKIPINHSNQSIAKTEKLAVIRNFTLEPHLDNILNFYAPQIEVEYYYLDLWMHKKLHLNNDVLMFLHLPYLMVDNYYNMYSIDNNERNRIAQQQSNIMISLIESIISHTSGQVYVALFVSDDYVNVVNDGEGFDAIVEVINHSIIQFASKNKRVTLINSPMIARRIGISKYFDLSGSYTTNSVISREALNYIVHEIVSKRESNNLPVKCLVLDCDNVLWGGILEEKGIDGILLSNSGIGKAYRDFQREILKLKSQGFLICICSKNDEHFVKKVFDEHPYMLLKWSDLCAAKVSFQPKSKSILELSFELKMPIQEMLFLDDSPFEIHEVAGSTQAKTLLLDPQKPHLFFQQLYRSGWCYRDFVSEYDRRRTDGYRNTTIKQYSAVPAEDINKMLSTQVVMRRAIQSDFPRISELSYRTHQFNMSGIKYDIADLNDLLVSSRYDLFVLCAKDSFGDLGIVATAIIQKKHDKIVIESFFVSCRIIGRNLENQFLTFINRELNIDTKQLHGCLKKTEYNQNFCNFYQQNGITVDLI